MTIVTINYKLSLRLVKVKCLSVTKCADRYIKMSPSLNPHNNGDNPFNDVAYFQTHGPIQGIHICNGWFIDS